MSSEVVDFESEKARVREMLESKSLALTSAITDDPRLGEMNKKHAFIVSYGGKPVVLAYVYNAAFKKEVVEFMSPASIEIIYANQSVQDGRLPVGLGTWWLKHTDRREYDTVIFDPNQPKQIGKSFNLYEGMAVQPIKGNWWRTLRHLYKILSNSDRDKFLYTVKWLAWCLQNPGTRAEVAVVLKGKQGAGKGFIFSQMVTIFGAHGIHLSNRSHLTGKFNGHLANCVFMFADEAYYPGEKEVEGTLNQIISEEKILIENKGMKAVIQKNCLHIAMASNEEWVVPASGDARRYYINEVNNTYAKNQISDYHRTKYFDALWGEMACGGREAMVYDLLNLDLKGWHPRKDVPETEEYRKQSRKGVSFEVTAMYKFLETGELPGTHINGKYVCKSYVIRNHIIEKNRRVQELKFIALMKDMGCHKIRKSDGVTWDFPSLEDMKVKFIRHYKQFEFTNMDDVWATTPDDY